MRIGDVDLRQRVLVVAEIGNNHEGDYALAQELVRSAASCGVDAVKFQTFRTRDFVRRSDTARFRRLESYELSQTQFTRLADLAHSLGLLFISTPLDLGSAEFLEPIVDALKIASGDITFYPLIERVLGSNKPVIISTGASDLEQVRATMGLVRRSARGGGADVAFLHCVSSYPAPPEEVNLRVIPKLREELGCPIGYSDHTLGIEAALLAVAMGAVIIEKHFTLNHNQSEFRDHKLSAEPDEMKALVTRIRQASVLLGHEEKRIQTSEAANVTAIRRSVVVSHDVGARHRLTAADLTWLRPATGMAPGEESRLIGRITRRALQAGEDVSNVDVE
jgi:sialic acid synthase SpsE